METVVLLDPMERVARLRDVPLFADLEPDDLARLADLVSERRYDSEEPVFSKDEPASEMLVVTAGQAEVIAPQDGRPVIELGPGSPVGELALLRRRPRMADVRAGADGLSALVVDGATLEAMFEERPRVAHAMLAALADKLATTSTLGA